MSLLEEALRMATARARTPVTAIAIPVNASTSRSDSSLTGSRHVRCALGPVS